VARSTSRTAPDRRSASCSRARDQGGWEDEEQVDDALQHTIHPAPDGSGDDADDRSHNKAERDDRKRRQPRVLHAQQGAGEQVPADFIGAEPVRSRWRQHCRSDAQLWIVGGKPGGKQGEKRHGNDAGDAHSIEPAGALKEMTPVPTAAHAGAT
jgi:hypothetical protein